MKIVKYTSRFLLNKSFIDLTHAHIKMQHDKLNFPEPDGKNYNWLDPKNMAREMSDQGVLQGLVLVDDNNTVYGYSLFDIERNIFTEDLVLSSIALIVSQKYTNSIWAGKLILETAKFAKTHGCKYVNWSVNSDTPGQQFFMNHPDRYKLIDQTYLEVV
jgi:hypothetical protein